MDETKEQFLDRRLEQIREGAVEAIRRKVAWLKRHNFPVWVSKNGHDVDATKNSSPEKDEE